MVGIFTQKKPSLNWSLLLILLTLLARPVVGQTLGCYTGAGPALNHLTAITEICPGQKAVLALQDFPSGEIAIWYASSDRSTIVATLTNTDPPFSPNPGNSRSFWVALRNTATNCESDLLEVKVTVLSYQSCPIRNPSKNRSYREIQEAHDDADPGDELLLSPGRYQATSVQKGLKLVGKPQLGQVAKPQISIQGLQLNTDADLEMDEGVFLIDGTLNLTKGHLRMQTNSALVIKGKIENGGVQSAIKMPLVGQSNAAGFTADGAAIPPGAIRIKSFSTLRKRFLPAYASDNTGAEQYFALLLETQSGNLANTFDLALAGPASTAESQSYPGLTREAETGIKELARAANQRPSKVDQIFLLGPAGNQKGVLNLTITAQANLGGPINPILWNWEPQGFDFTILTIDNDVALFRGVRMILSGYNTFSTVEPVDRFSPFVVAEGSPAGDSPGNDRTSSKRSWQSYRNSTIDDCPNPIPAGCNDLVQVTLLNQCIAAVTPDMVLEGDPGCSYDAENFTVTIFYPDGAQTEGYVDRPGRFLFEVTGPQGFNCRGEIQAEDKTAPRFECAPPVIDHVYRTYEVQTVDGRLSEQQRGQINFSDYSCYQDEYGSPGDCPEPYDVIEFYVSEADIYTFEAWDPERDPDFVENDNELHIALFQGSFNPLEPCANMLAQSNVVSSYGVVEADESPDGRFRLALPLKPGQKYSLLVAQDDCSRDRGDQWIVYAFSDGDGEILDDTESLPDRFGDPRPLPVKKQLYCSDIAYILNNSEYTKNPQATDNCDLQPQVWFDDVLTQNGDCGDIYITRTWQILDAAGNPGESCVQRIEFKRPGLRDVQKPPTTVAIECDEIEPEWLDENGHPKPQIAGAPFVITAFGIADLNEAFCNVGADYEDIGDIEVCANTHKIVRQWTILDWCRIDGQWTLNNGTKINWRQVIKVGDFSAPTANAGEDIVVSAGPFSCAGVLTIPAISVTDNCSESTVSATIYKVVEEAEVDRYGRPTGNLIHREEWFYEGAVGSTAPDLEVGIDYKLYYHVEDACGNAADPAPVTVRVEDNIAPVAVCTDDLTISIGGDGIGRITAADLDEGSWDNCALDQILISRQLANDPLRDAWLAQVESLSFSDLVFAGNEDPSGDGAEQWIRRDSEETILRRKNGLWYTGWRSEQYFICDDMNAAVTLEMVAFDAAGNINVCWMQADVEDKVAPYCTAPPSVTLDCTNLPYGFNPADDVQLDDLFGLAASTDNCEGDTAYQVRTQVDWDCNSGVIERWFEARDKNGLTSRNSCYQRITVLPVHNYEIRFPADADAECGQPSPDTVLVDEIGCDLLSVNVIDERFAVNEGDACYKIRRTYQVINWCEYNGEDAPVIIGRNEDCDGETGEEDIYVLRRPERTYVDRDNDEHNHPSASPCNNGAKGHLTNSLLEDRLTSNGYWQYTQLLKVYDRTAPLINVTAPQPFCADNVFVRCSGDIEIPFTVSEECDAAGLSIEIWLDLDDDGDLDFEVTTAVLTGSYPHYRLSNNYPIGNYAFEIRVADGCNNAAVRRVPFAVVDCKAPTPICINGLAVELMPQEPGTDADGDGDEDAGAMSVWATDFKVSLDQDCSPGFTYSINRVGETPDQNRAGLILTCDDPDTVMVEIYIWDNADNPYAVQPDGTVGGPNYDHCLTYVVVQDNMFDLCNHTSLAVAGLITTENDQSVEDVEVRLSGPATQMQTTRSDGLYEFGSLLNGADYTIQPWKDNAHLNGVSTFDLVLLTKHLLGIRKLESPYLLIAADVNRSQTISTLDLIQLRKMVLSVDNRFRNNSSWRFIPKSYVFPYPEAPWSAPFPELLSFNDLNVSMRNADFVGIKIGDLNGNARPNSLSGNQREIAGAFQMHVEEQDLIAGQEYRIVFTTEQLADILGYQFTLSHEQLELIDIEYGVAKAEHLAVVEEGLITTSWNEPDFDATSTATLFTLIVKAKVSGRLSERLDLNSRRTPAEAYNRSEELLGVQLHFSGTTKEKIHDAPELFQNEPNPFAEETVIRFYLPEARNTTIRIHDLNGRTLRLIRGHYGKGEHRLVLRRTDLPLSGVLYYSLETDDFTATRKMVVVGD